MHLAAAVKVPRQIVIETPTFNPTVEPYGRRFLTIRIPSWPAGTWNITDMTAVASVVPRRN